MRVDRRQRAGVRLDAKRHYLELQYGEADWRGEILTPAERFVGGTIQVPNGPASAWS
jgi:hypothetical protein